MSNLKHFDNKTNSIYNKKKFNALKKHLLLIKSKTAIFCIKVKHTRLLLIKNIINSLISITYR